MSYKHFQRVLRSCKWTLSRLHSSTGLGTWQAPCELPAGQIVDPRILWNLAYKMHDMQTGLPALRQLIRDGINTNYEMMLTVAFYQLFNPAHDYSQFPSVERFAIGKELSEHILAEARLQDDDDRAHSYLMVAWYYHASGNKDRAVELLELALQPLDGPGPDGLKDDLLQTLADYKGEK